MNFAKSHRPIYTYTLVPSSSYRNDIVLELTHWFPKETNSAYSARSLYVVYKLINLVPMIDIASTEIYSVPISDFEDLPEINRL